jgi:ribosome recycling factor
MTVDIDMYASAEGRMSKTLSAFEDELKKIRSGRASTGLVDHIHVDYYGSQLPINQVANVTTEDARTILVTPWEKSMLAVIEKAILSSDIGLNPIASASNLRLPIPSMTEETRKEIVKLVKNTAENSRVSIRNIRREINNDLRQKLKNKEITEDDQKNSEDKIQSMTDSFVKKIDDLLSKKEEEILSI